MNLWQRIRKGRHAPAEVESPARPQSDPPLSQDAIHVRKVIDLAMRVGEALVAVGAPAQEIVLATIRVAAAFGIEPVHVDITYNSIAVSYHRSETESPFTLVRVVRSPIPDHAKLRDLQALVADIRAKKTDVDTARARFDAIQSAPFKYSTSVIVLAQGALAAGVGLLYGVSFLVLLVILAAGSAAALTQHQLAKVRVPFFFSQAVGAMVVTAVAALTNWLGTMGVPFLLTVRPGVIVAAGVVMMLAGMSVVAAAHDAIDGFALTASGRLLDLVLLTLGVVIGIIFGASLAQEVGIGIPLSTYAPSFGPFWAQVLGALMIAVSVAVWNGAGLRTVLVSAGLGTIAWLVFSLVSATGAGYAVASGVGALAASLVGIVLAHRLHVPSIAVSTAAIVSLVPGSVLYRATLGLIQANGNEARLTLAFSDLLNAGAIAIALASGATLGLILGAPLRESLRAVVNRRGRVR